MSANGTLEERLWTCQAVFPGRTPGDPASPLTERSPAFIPEVTKGSWKGASFPERDAKTKPLQSDTHEHNLKKKKKGEPKTTYKRGDGLILVFSIFPKHCAFSTVNMQYFYSQGQKKREFWYLRNTKKWVREATQNKAGPCLKKCPHKSVLSNFPLPSALCPLGSDPHILGSRQLLLPKVSSATRLGVRKGEHSLAGRQRKGELLLWAPTGPRILWQSLFLHICRPVGSTQWSSRDYIPKVGHHGPDGKMWFKDIHIIPFN